MHISKEHNKTFLFQSMLSASWSCLDNQKLLDVLEVKKLQNVVFIQHLVPALTKVHSTINCGTTEGRVEK